MRKRIHSCTRILLIFILGISLFANADTNVEAAKQAVETGQKVIETMQEIGRILLEGKDPLRQAAGFAAMGMHSVSPDDSRLYAQALINILEGADSELYDPAVEVAISYTLGIRPLLGQLRLAEEEWSDIDDQTTGASGLGDGWNRYLGLLRLASEAMQEGLRSDAEATDLEDAFLSAFALLIVVDQGFREMLSMWGFEIWVSAGESIQAAIDRAWPGATIYLEPGIYRESLDINKNLTLSAGPLREWSDLSQFGYELYIVILEPVASQVGITIRSSDSIQVDIHQLAIQNASTAMAISGNAQVNLYSVWIQESSIGIDISDAASLNATSCFLEYFDIVALRCSDSANSKMSSCYLEYSETAATVSDEARLEMTDCKLGLSGIDLELQGGSTSLVDCRIWDPILVSGEASLEMIDTSIYGSSGSGIVASDHAQLSLSGGNITRNDCDGILLTGASTLDMRGVYCAENDGFGVRALSAECPLEGDHQLEPFSGTITGKDNIIPTGGEYMSNGLGGICPEGYAFLTASAPAEVSVEPGQSIQAAIDLVADGGVVTIEPGTYLEAVAIDKSLSLISAADDSVGEGESGDVILDWDVGEAVISISSSASIAVVLSDLTLQGGNAGWGIEVGENATVELLEIAFRDLGTAIRVKDGGSVIASHCDFSGNGSAVAATPKGSFTASWCTFTDNRQAVHASLGSVCTLTDSTISGCTGDSAAISASCTDLELRSCTIRDSVGSAIHLAGGEASKLHLVNSHLTGNAYGIDFTYGGCNPGDDPNWEGTPHSAFSYGTFSGWNNDIPGPDEPNGNREGAFWYCFPDWLGDPSFLTEPKPEDE